MVSPTIDCRAEQPRAAFLGALLLCGVSDGSTEEQDEQDPPFLGALLLCGVSDAIIYPAFGRGRFLGALLLCGVSDRAKARAKEAATSF